MKKIDLRGIINVLKKIHVKNCKIVWNISQSFFFFCKKSFDTSSRERLLSSYLNCFVKYWSPIQNKVLSKDQSPVNMYVYIKDWSLSVKKIEFSSLRWVRKTAHCLRGCFTNFMDCSFLLSDMTIWSCYMVTLTANLNRPIMNCSFVSRKMTIWSCHIVTLLTNGAFVFSSFRFCILIICWFLYHKSCNYSRFFHVIGVEDHSSFFD